MAAASTGLKVCLLGEGECARASCGAWPAAPAPHVAARAGRVGKTSILLKFVKDEFDDKQASSMDASYMEKVVSVDGTVSGDSGVSVLKPSLPHPATPPRAGAGPQAQYLGHGRAGAIPCTDPLVLP